MALDPTQGAAVEHSQHPKGFRMSLGLCSGVGNVLRNAPGEMGTLFALVALVIVVEAEAQLVGITYWGESPSNALFSEDYRGVGAPGRVVSDVGGEGAVGRGFHVALWKVGCLGGEEGGVLDWDDGRTRER